MPFQLLEVTADSDFTPLMAALWESYLNPYLKLMNMTFPIQGTTPEAHSQRIAESVQFTLDDHSSDPTSHWFKVVNAETGEIVGGAEWNICKENIYGSSGVKGTWWKEGEDREFVAHLLRQYTLPVMTYMQKPYMRMLYNLFHSHRPVENH